MSIEKPFLFANFSLHSLTSLPDQQRQIGSLKSSNGTDRRVVIDIRQIGPNCRSSTISSGRAFFSAQAHYLQPFYRAPAVLNVRWRCFHSSNLSLQVESNMRQLYSSMYYHWPAHQNACHMWFFTARLNRIPASRWIFEAKRILKICSFKQTASRLTGTTGVRLSN